MSQPHETTPTEQSRRDIADWNRIAEHYSAAGDENDPTQNPMYSHLEAVLWECLDDLEGLHVLDLGCGDG